MRWLNKNRLPGSKKKKEKNKRKVTLLLEKDGEFKEFQLNFGSKWSLLKAVKKLANLNRKNWNLIDTIGDPGKEKAMFDQVIAGLNPSAKQMLDFAGLPGMPSFLKKYFNKGELKKE
jgi:hypothetical protein